jgi:hypothetical protein
LAAVLNKTELMVLNFHQHSGLSQRWGQTLLDMVRHPEFKPKLLQSATVIHLLWRCERPFKETPQAMYNVWKPGDGNQILELVICDYLPDLREIFRDPQWKELFDRARSTVERASRPCFSHNL